jgi:hypothetical protein
MCNCASCIQDEARDKIWDLEWKIGELEKERNLFRDQMEVALAALKWVASHASGEIENQAERALEQINEIEER